MAIQTQAPSLSTNISNIALDGASFLKLLGDEQAKDVVNAISKKITSEVSGLKLNPITVKAPLDRLLKGLESDKVKKKLEVPILNFYKKIFRSLTPNIGVKGTVSFDKIDVSKLIDPKNFSKSVYKKISKSYSNFVSTIFDQASNSIESNKIDFKGLNINNFIDRDLLKKSTSSIFPSFVPFTNKIEKKYAQIQSTLLNKISNKLRPDSFDIKIGEPDKTGKEVINLTSLLGGILADMDVKTNRKIVKKYNEMRNALMNKVITFLDKKSSSIHIDKTPLNIMSILGIPPEVNIFTRFKISNLRNKIIKQLSDVVDKLQLQIVTIDPIELMGGLPDLSKFKQEFEERLKQKLSTSFDSIPISIMPSLPDPLSSPQTNTNEIPNISTNEDTAVFGPEDKIIPVDVRNIDDRIFAKLRNVISNITPVSNTIPPNVITPPNDSLLSSLAFNPSKILGALLGGQALMTLKDLFTGDVKNIMDEASNSLSKGFLENFKDSILNPSRALAKVGSLTGEILAEYSSEMKLIEQEMQRISIQMSKNSRRSRDMERQLSGTEEGKKIIASVKTVKNIFEKKKAASGYFNPAAAAMILQQTGNEEAAISEINRINALPESQARKIVDSLTKQYDAIKNNILDAKPMPVPTSSTKPANAVRVVETMGANSKDISDMKNTIASKIDDLNKTIPQLATSMEQNMTGSFNIGNTGQSPVNNFGGLRDPAYEFRIDAWSRIRN